MRDCEAERQKQTGELFIYKKKGEKDSIIFGSSFMEICFIENSDFFVSPSHDVL